ncbi:MAG: hypothetical protein WCE38_06240 [Burkholderiales bacterium]
MREPATNRVPHWDPDLLMRLAARHRISMIFAVPAQLAMLLNHPEFDPRRLRTLATVVLGARWGWTGDLALKHASHISLVGRTKELILSGGYNIYPVELGEALLAHSDVVECAVFGMPDSTWGELPVAAVVTRRGACDVDAIMAHVAQRAARHKRVRRILFVERTPRTPAGKVKRHVVRRECLGT